MNRRAFLGVASTGLCAGVARAGVPPALGNPQEPDEEEPIILAEIARGVYGRVGDLEQTDRIVVSVDFLAHDRSTFETCTWEDYSDPEAPSGARVTVPTNSPAIRLVAVRAEVDDFLAIWCPGLGPSFTLHLVFPDPIALSVFRRARRYSDRLVLVPSTLAAAR